MHSVTADQSVVRCNVKSKAETQEVKTAMRRLASAGCVFDLETTGICPGTTVYRCEGYKSTTTMCISQEIVGPKKKQTNKIKQNK